MHQRPIVGFLLFGLLAAQPLEPADAKAALIPGPPRQETRAALSGVVRDQEAQPVAGVEVIALGLSRVAFSDDRGAFRLERLPPGTFEVHFRRLGFGLARRTVTLVSGKRLEVEVQLHALVPVTCEVRSRAWSVACPVTGGR